MAHSPSFKVELVTMSRRSRSLDFSSMASKLLDDPYVKRLIPLLSSSPLTAEELELYSRLATCELRSVMNLPPGIMFALLLAGRAAPVHPTALIQCICLFALGGEVPALWYTVTDLLVSYWCRGFEGAVRVAVAVLYAFALPLDVTRAPQWEDFRVEELVNVEPERIVLAVALRQLLDGGSIEAVGTAPAAMARRAVYAAGPEHGLSDDVNMALLAAHVVLGAKGAVVLAHLRNDCLRKRPDGLDLLASVIGAWDLEHFAAARRGSLTLLKELIHLSSCGALPSRPKRPLVLPFDDKYLTHLLADSEPLRDAASLHADFFDVFRELVHQASSRMQNQLKDFVFFRQAIVAGQWRAMLWSFLPTIFATVDCAALTHQQCRDLVRHRLVQAIPAAVPAVQDDGVVLVLSECDIDVSHLLLRLPASLTAAGGQSLASLTVLRIRGSGIRDGDVAVLMKGLNWRQLTWLDLGFNVITDTGFSSIHEHLSHHFEGARTPLQLLTLSLSYNCITDVSCGKIGDLLRGAWFLSRLDLPGHPQLTDLQGSIRHGALQRPWAGFCEVTVNVLRSAISPATCAELSQPHSFNGCFISSYDAKLYPSQGRPSSCRHVGDHQTQHFQANRNIIEAEWREQLDRGEIPEPHLLLQLEFATMRDDPDVAAQHCLNAVRAAESMTGPAISRLMTHHRDQPCVKEESEKWTIDTNGECLGTGAYGVVYRARHRDRPQDLYVAKIFAPDKFYLEEVSTFVDLAPIAGVVSPVFGFARDISLLGEPPEEKFVLISRYGGESVAQLLRSKASDHTLPLASATEFGAAMRSVAAIVKQLHAAGIAHGDLHSGNLLWERDEKRFSLVDFGLSVGSATWRHRISDYERLLGIGLRMVLRRCRQLDRDAAALNPLRLLQSDTAAPYLDELRHIAREAFELMFVSNSDYPSANAAAGINEFLARMSESTPSSENTSFLAFDSPSGASDHNSTEENTAGSHAAEAGRIAAQIDHGLLHSTSWTERAVGLCRSEPLISQTSDVTIANAISASPYATLIVRATLQELWMASAVDPQAVNSQLLTQTYAYAPSVECFRAAYDALLQLATKGDPKCRMLANAVVAVVLEPRGKEGTTSAVWGPSVARRLEAHKSLRARPWDGSAPLAQRRNTNDVKCVGYSLTQLVSQHVPHRPDNQDAHGARAAAAANAFMEYLWKLPELHGHGYFNAQGLLDLPRLASGPHADALSDALGIVYRVLAGNTLTLEGAIPNMRVRRLKDFSEVFARVAKREYVAIGVQSVSDRTDDVPCDLLTDHYTHEEHRAQVGRGGGLKITHGHMRVIQSTTRTESDGRVWWHLRDTLLFDNQLDLLKPYGCNLVFNGKFVLAPSSEEECGELATSMARGYLSFFVVTKETAG
jgi:serine/threonine protein kinase